MFWIIPPLLFVVPIPVILKEPVPPRRDRIIPLFPPFDSTLSNVTLEVPIFILLKLTAVAVVVTILLPLPVTFKVPPPVAVNASFAAVERVSCPERLIVAPVLLLINIPVLLALAPTIVPLNVMVPPSLLRTCKERPDKLFILAAIFTLPEPEDMLTLGPLELLTVPPLTLIVAPSLLDNAMPALFDN